MKSKLGYFLDNILTIFIVFLITFLWTRCYVHNIIVLLIISFIVTFVISFLFLMWFDKKRNTKIYSIKTQRNIENLENAFLFMEQNDILEYIKKHLLDFNPVIKEEYILLTKNNKNILLLPIFCARKINNQDYINIFKKYKDFKEEIIVLSVAEESLGIELRNRLSKEISFISLQNFYNSYLNGQELPTLPFKQIKKKKLDDFLKIILNRKQAKKYFLLTIFFCFYSFLFRYNIYYLIFSLLLGILTIISLKNKKYNIIEEKIF